MKKTLFLFIDESGNFDFTKNGTKYFVLTSLKTYNPSSQRIKLLKLKYKLLQNGFNQEFFHATEDRQFVRNEVFNLIQNIYDVSVDGVVVDKTKVAKKFKFEYKFYESVCLKLLKKVFLKSDENEIGNIIIILGAIFTREKQELILKTLKKYLKMKFNLPFEIYFHKSQSDLNSQIADYFGWAIYIKSERNEVRPYNIIKARVKLTNPSILAEEPEGSY